MQDFNVVRTDIVTKRGTSRGLATVEFSNKEDVEAAIAKFDRTEHFGRQLFIRQDQPPPSEQTKEEQRGDPVELFVGNLPFSTTWQDLKDIFRRVGNVVRADVVTGNDGRSRGYGLVTLRNEGDAEKAISMFQNYKVDGRPIEVRKSKESGSGGGKKPAAKNSDFTEGVVGGGEPSAVIFVGNLPYITTESDLFELFETIGRVSRAEVQFNHQGRPSGNAVVEFELGELADLAIKNLNGYNYGGRELQLSFALQPLTEESEDAAMEEEN